MLPVYTAGLLYRLSAATGLYALNTGGRVDAELSAMLAGFGQLLAQMTALRRDAFPQLCGEERLRAWERLLGIPARAAATQEMRRAEVLARLSLAPYDYTPEGLRRCLLAVGIVADITEDFSTGRLTVTVARFTNPAADTAAVIEAAAALLPAHLESVFLYGGLDWTAWEAANTAWQLFDASGYSWQQHDTRTE